MRPDGSDSIVHAVSVEMEQSQAAGGVIELAHRESGATHIALFWSREDATVKVVVVGSSEDDSFELEAAESRALDVFYHPFAYAALRRD
jgi:hypothetical protein